MDAVLCLPELPSLHSMVKLGIIPISRGPLRPLLGLNAWFLSPWTATCFEAHTHTGVSIGCGFESFWGYAMCIEPLRSIGTNNVMGHPSFNYCLSRTL